MQAQTIGELMINNACITIDNTTTFEATVDLTGPYNTGTEIILQVSNKFGSFENASIELDVQTLTDEIPSGITQTIVFDIFYPINDGSGTTFASDDYRARALIRDTGQRGLVSEAFSVYIYDNQVLTLEPRNNCNLTTLTASPVNLEEYNWYLFDPTAGEVLIETTTTNTFTPPSPGRYFFRPTLGNCQLLIPQARSNEAIIDDGMSMNTIDFEIASSSTTNEICADDPPILLTTNAPMDDALSFQWLRNNQPIEGANNRSFQVNGLQAQGTYSLNITNSEFGFDSDCRTSSSQNQIAIDLLNPTITLLQPFEVISIPGNTSILRAEVTGENTSITWFRDNNAIPNSNVTSLEISEPGTYTAQVTGESRCSQNTVMSNEVIEVLPFDVESIIIAYNDPLYTSCTSETVQINVVSIEAINASGGTSTITDRNILDILPLVWRKDDNPITVDTEGSSININNASDNGVYSVQIENVDPDELPTVSNELSVILSLSQLTIQSNKADNLINTNESIELSVILPEASLTNITYQWIKNGVDIPNNATDSTFNVTSPGRYSVRVNSSECNETTLDEIVINANAQDIPNLITPTLSNNKTWSLPLEFTDENIAISIYDNNGKEVFSQTNYQNNWPLSSTELEESIYYYVISAGGEELKKGTITILR